MSSRLKDLPVSLYGIRFPSPACTNTKAGGLSTLKAFLSTVSEAFTSASNIRCRYRIANDLAITLSGRVRMKQRHGRHREWNALSGVDLASYEWLDLTAVPRYELPMRVTREANARWRLPSASSILSNNHVPSFLPHGQTERSVSDSENRTGPRKHVTPETLRMANPSS